MRIVVVFGMGESFRSIWTHNGRWLASISVDHAQNTCQVQYPGSWVLTFPQEIKGPYVASSGDRKRSRDRVLTARVTRGGSCGKVGEVGGPIYAEIEYI